MPSDTVSFVREPRRIPALFALEQKGKHVNLGRRKQSKTCNEQNLKLHNSLNSYAVLVLFWHFIIMFQPHIQLYIFFSLSLFVLCQRKKLSIYEFIDPDSIKTHGSQFDNSYLSRSWARLESAAFHFFPLSHVFLQVWTTNNTFFVSAVHVKS